MSTPQHTPGPWFAQYRQYTMAIGGGGDDLGGAHLVALLHHDSNPNSRADARLIAAAPELLNALKRFAHAMEQKSYPELQGIASDAFQAISKVEGREP